MRTTGGHSRAGASHRASNRSRWDPPGSHRSPGPPSALVHTGLTAAVSHELAQTPPHPCAWGGGPPVTTRRYNCEGRTTGPPSAPRLSLGRHTRGCRPAPLTGQGVLAPVHGLPHRCVCCHTSWEGWPRQDSCSFLQDMVIDYLPGARHWGSPRGQQGTRHRNPL